MPISDLTDQQLDSLIASKQGGSRSIDQLSDQELDDLIASKQQGIPAFPTGTGIGDFAPAVELPSDLSQLRFDAPVSLTDALSVALDVGEVRTPQPGIIPPGTTESLMSKIFQPQEPFEEGLGKGEEIRRVIANLIRGTVKAPVGVAGGLLEDPVETAKGLVTFIPEEARRTIRALPEQRGTGSFIGQLQHILSVTKEERKQARAELFEHPEGPVFAAAALGGIAGRVSKVGRKAPKTPATEAVKPPTVSLPKATAVDRLAAAVDRLPARGEVEAALTEFKARKEFNQINLKLDKLFDGGHKFGDLIEVEFQGRRENIRVLSVDKKGKIVDAVDINDGIMIMKDGKLAGGGRFKTDFSKSERGDPNNIFDEAFRKQFTPPVRGAKVTKKGTGDYNITEGGSFINAEVVEGHTLLIKSSNVPPSLRRKGVYTRLLKDLLKRAKKDHPKLEHFEGNVISKEAEAAARRFKSTEELLPKETPPLLRTRIDEVLGEPIKPVEAPKVAKVPPKPTEVPKPPTVSLPEATKSDRAVFQEKNIPLPKPLTKSSPTPEQIKKALEPKVIIRQPKEPTTVGSLGANPKVAAELGKSVIDAAKSISQSTAAMVEDVIPKPRLRSGTKAVKEVMIEHDRQIRNAEFTARQLEKVIADAVPDSKRQMLMTKAYENKLKGPNWKQLTKPEKALVRWAAAEKKKLNKFVADNKIVQTLPESENFNHIKHVWQNPETLEPYRAFYGKFTKRAVGGHERKIPTIERGEKLGLIHAETNLGKLIGLEWIDMMQAHQSRQMFGTIHSIGGEVGKTIVLRRGAPPRPIRAIERWDILQRQGLTDGYVRYSHPALDKTLAIKDGPRTTFLKGAVGVQEEIYPFVRAYIENPTYGTLSQLNFASKSMKLGASLFHPMSLGMQELANFRAPFVNIPRGLRLGRQLGPEMKLLHQEGLELFKGYEDLGLRNQFFEGTATLGKIGNVATKPIALMRDFIFDIVQPGMKTSFAFDQINKMMPRYLKGTDWTPEMVWEAVATGKPLPKEALRAARDVVKKADGHFSGEHYKRSLLETNRFMARMYFSPEARKFWQAALLSPTWQREHLLVAKNVAKSFMPDKLIKKLGLEEIGPIKSQFRKYALGAVSMIGAVDLWNQMSTQIMDGEAKHIWENPEGKGFAVRAWWDEPSYKVIDKNGKVRTIQGGPAYIRPLKSVFEVAEWAKDPFKKFSYKLSPGVTAIGRQIIPDKFRPEYRGIEDMPRRVKDFVLDVSTPIVIDQAIDVIKGKKTPLGGILPFFGFPTSKVKNKSQGAEIGIIKDLFSDGKKDEAITRWTKWNEKHPEEQITGGKDGHINANKIRARELSKAKTKAKAGR